MVTEVVQILQYDGVSCVERVDDDVADRNTAFARGIVAVVPEDLDATRKLYNDALRPGNMGKTGSFLKTDNVVSPRKGKKDCDFTQGMPRDCDLCCYIKEGYQGQRLRFVGGVLSTRTGY